MVAATISLSGLARTLVQQERLLEVDAEAIQTQANASNIGFVTQLIRSKKMSAIELAEFAAQTFGYPLLDLNAIDLDQLPRDLITSKLMQERRVLALHKRGTHIFVATSDPTNVQALDDIKFQTSLAVDPIVVEDDKLGTIVDKLSESAMTQLDELAGDELELDFHDEDAAAQKDAAAASAEIDDAPVVKYL